MFVHVLKVERYKNSVQEYIDKFFKGDLSCNCYPKDILRLLFLMCLSHDYGYIIEKRRRDDPDFKKDLKEIEEEIEELEKIKRINKKFFSKPYDLSTVKRYFEYRKYREHGISGGALLFYRLMKNFEEKEKIRNGGCFVKNIDGKEKIRKEDCFVENNLLWCRRNDEIFYALVSSIIIKHNIWYVTDFEKIEEYEEKGLDYLILRDPKKRLSFKKSPLLYLFCILDTIEPVKAFYDRNDKKLSVSEILKNVEFSIDENSIRIGVNLAKEREREKVINYICKIRTLQDWLNISVEYVGTPNPFKEVKLILK